MARLRSTGLELGSNTAIEFDAVFSPTVDATAARTGGFGLHTTLVSTAAQWIIVWNSGSGAAGPYYPRAYLKIVTLPGGNCDFMCLNDGTNFCGVRLTTTGSLRLQNGSTQIGSDSATLNVGQWYRIEMLYDKSGGAGASVLTAQIDGVPFATSSALTITPSVSRYSIGANFGLTGGASSSSGQWYIDDVAINDSSGSFQNSYPGPGSIVHLRPSAAGDNTQWTSTGTNWTAVSEVTPDDSTSGNRAAVLNKVDDYNVDDTPGGLDSAATINVASVGMRFTSDSAVDPSKFKLRFKSSSGGTIALSPEIVPASTSYRTNAPATPNNYPLTLYQTPDAASLTKSNLDTSQIGVIITTASGTAQVARISTEWLLVEYVPSVGSGPTGLKTINGLAEASVKTINGVTLASTKSWNGLT